MAIKNRITVGLKQILEVDSDPKTTGASAPMGSMALWKDGAFTAKQYLKVGLGDFNWAEMTHEFNISAWKISNSTGSGLNILAEKMYFGSDTGNFDIGFVRNGTEIMKLVSTGLEMVMPVIKRDIALEIQSVQNLKLVSKKPAIIVRDFNTNANKFQKCDFFYEVSTSNPTYNYQAPSESSLKPRVAEFTIIVKKSTGEEAIFVKSMAVSGTDTMIEKQDDFTARQSAMAGVEASLSFNTGAGLYELAFSGLTGTNTISINREEKALL